MLELLINRAYQKIDNGAKAVTITIESDLDSMPTYQIIIDSSSIEFLDSNGQNTSKTFIENSLSSAKKISLKVKRV